MSPAADNPIPFRWARSGRNHATVVAVAAAWVVLCTAYVVFDAALFIIGALALFTLPALYDLAANPHAGLELDSTGLRWFSGRRHAQLTLAEIDHIRFDTRLDFSVRATAVLAGGRKIRLPFEATPPHNLFEAACIAHGVQTKRHHFSPLG